MRKIKFRVWNDVEWLHVDEITLWDLKNIPKGWTVQQYTGLKDESDKEIYEGDILHYVFDGASYPKEAKDEILTCLWGTFGGMYSFENKDSEYYWAEIANRCSVVGNIFENPELLEK
jgi:uncharacterized phage protein (TIGR01671 family)